MSINWYPGHMHKAIREIKKMLPRIDVIIEILDARIPYSSQNPLISDLAADKPRIKLLNKSDLADPEITAQWIEHYQQDKKVRVFTHSNKNPEKLQALMPLIKQLVPDTIAKTRNIDAMIMGVPNVGKSTLINLLAGRQIAKTGNEPAVTKGQQRIDCRNGLILFDTPGILWPKIYNPNSGYRLAATGAIKNTAMSYDDVAFFLAEYLMLNFPEALKSRYQLSEPIRDEMTFFEIVGKKRGCLGKGGRVDLSQVSKLFLDEFREATIARITLETPAMIIQEQILETQLKAEREAKIKARKDKKMKKKKY